jgi:cytochrome P450
MIIPAQVPSAEIDLLSPSFVADPYPVYDRLRRTAPVWWSPQLECWLVARHDDAVAVLRDARSFSSALDLPPSAADNPLAPFIRLTLRWLLFQDPPQQTRQRVRLLQAFAPRMRGLRACARRTANELLDRGTPAGPMDLLWDYAYPLTAHLLAGLFAADRDEQERLTAWSRGIGWANAFPKDRAAVERGRCCVVELTNYFRQLTARRRRQPGDDLLSAWLTAGPLDTEAEEEAICAQCLLLLFAGNETTPHLIGNGLLALLQWPETLELLRRQPSLMPGAVEELLRYDSPVQGVNRQASADVVLRGQRIGRGEEVVVLLGSANRDPSRFAEPDRLNIRRTDTGHLGFGHGVHYCLGAALARLTAEAALTTLLRWWPELRTEGVPAWRKQSLVARGLAAFPVQG